MTHRTTPWYPKSLMKVFLNIKLTLPQKQIRGDPPDGLSMKHRDCTSRCTHLIGNARKLVAHSFHSARVASSNPTRVTLLAWETNAHASEHSRSFWHGRLMPHLSGCCACGQVRSISLFCFAVAGVYECIRSSCRASLCSHMW